MMDGIQTQWPSGIKKTKQRAFLLATLEQAGKPVSAQDLYFKMKEEGASLSLSTAYRILGFFISVGLVNKISVMGSEVWLYELNCNQHKHYAVCLNCHKIIEMEHCPIETFMPELEDGDFQVTGHNLEIYGLCKACKESAIQHEKQIKSRI